METDAALKDAKFKLKLEVVDFVRDTEPIRILRGPTFKLKIIVEEARREILCLQRRLVMLLWGRRDPWLLIERGRQEKNSQRN